MEDRRFSELVDTPTSTKQDFPKEFLRRPSTFTSRRRIYPFPYAIERVKKVHIRYRPPNTSENTAFTSTINITWLRTWCFENLGSADFSDQLLIALGEKEELAIQQGLFEILGAENMEIMSTLMQNRRTLLFSNYKEQMTRERGKMSTKQKHSFLSEIVLKDVEKEKLKRKIDKVRKKITKRENLDEKERLEEEKNEKLLLAFEDQLQEHISKKKIEEREEEGSRMIRVLEEHNPDLDFGEMKKKNQMRLVKKERYDEYHVDAPEPKEIDESKLVVVETLPKWSRSAFQGFKKLNFMQSTCYHMSFHSNENLLICAPTGCGKTNVAMLTVLHEISKHRNEEGVIDKDAFKVLYVTPMKALANEIVGKFGRRLIRLGIKVKEYTGDMKLSRKEIENTQVIVTTPEKWDVITRRQSDTTLIQSVKLIIFDEIHLLNEDRGPVIECIVARTLRQIEQTQSMIRLVGLSATLPNYEDVAMFLRVNNSKGLFYFDSSYRPVPLSQQYIQVAWDMQDEVCFDKAEKTIEEGHQCMIFVHSRRGTKITCEKLLEIAKERQRTGSNGKERNAGNIFEGKKLPYDLRKRLNQSTNKDLQAVACKGLGFHHAGMLRRDRNLVEDLFRKGCLKVLSCTATLAWGVNLPAHTVIIKGTEVYNSNVGKMVDIGVLDVMQIFGRAGRPQYDKTGEGIIITKPPKALEYLAKMNNAFPIESQLGVHMENHLNAEVVLGSVTNVREGMRWLKSTYLFVRIQKNPINYGINHKQWEVDKSLMRYRNGEVIRSAKVLDKCKMIRYDDVSGNLSPTFLGRVASHYYIHYKTIRLFIEKLRNDMPVERIINVISKAKEFEQIKVRREESELKFYSESIWDGGACLFPVPGGGRREDDEVGRIGKVSTLFQCFVSRVRFTTFALICDCAYVIDNFGRLLRGVLDIALNKRWSSLTDNLLKLSQSLERRMWAFQDYHHPLRQFESLQHSIIEKLEGNNRTGKYYGLQDLNEMEDPRDLDHILGGGRGVGKNVLSLVNQIPYLEIKWYLQPVTRHVMKIEITLTVSFEWTNKKYHNESEFFWLFIEDQETGKTYHHETFSIPRKKAHEEISISCMIPLIESKLKSTKVIRVVPDKWIGVDIREEIDFSEIVLPTPFPKFTELYRNLKPLKIADAFSLGNEPKGYKNYFPFTELNPIQTQVFHTLYHSDRNVLIGAATGSGKTVLADLALLRFFKKYDRNRKAVYVAPLKALVIEKLKYWKDRLKMIGKRVVELTGDTTPDSRMLRDCDLIVTTPEKWDGVSRHWKQRRYVREIGLIIVDEIHLIGTERGHALEMLISRQRFITKYMNEKRKNKASKNQEGPVHPQFEGGARIIGLGTSIANSDDVALWLGICPQKRQRKLSIDTKTNAFLHPTGGRMYNFKHTVRPVQLDTHIQGYTEKHYCPRMAMMNKPAYQAILEHSINKPVLIFVSSRRQTRITAQSIIQLCSSDGRQFQFSRMGHRELADAQAKVRDGSLLDSLPYGIGLHHAGLARSDRILVEDLYRDGKIQILVSTTTLAWGVNLPAHLVVVKGTEYFDACERRYIQYPTTDILQMMGRAGRPQYDDRGTVVVLVDSKHKDFYKKFLFDSFPVESGLHEKLHDHLNAEIVAGTITKKQDAIDFLSWTFLFRRLLKNPTFYEISLPEEENDDDDNEYNETNTPFSTTLKRKEFPNEEAWREWRVTRWLSLTIDEVIDELEENNCLSLIGEDPSKQIIRPRKAGQLASYYYVNYQSVSNLYMKLEFNNSVPDIVKLMQWVCESCEFDELPVRHNEDQLNEGLSEKVPYGSYSVDYESPNVKAHLLLQGFLSRINFPIPDYNTDLKSVLDQCGRLIQCYIDVTAHRGQLETTLNFMHLNQMICQGQWFHESSLRVVMYCAGGGFQDMKNLEKLFAKHQIRSICELVEKRDSDLHKLFREKMRLGEHQSKQMISIIKNRLPRVRMNIVSISTVAIDPKFKKRSKSHEEVIIKLRIERDSMIQKFAFTTVKKNKRILEGWYLVVGQMSDDKKNKKELYALKRIRIDRRWMNVDFSFQKKKGNPEICSLYLISDCYIGLDQEYSIRI